MRGAKGLLVALNHLYFIEQKDPNLRAGLQGGSNELIIFEPLSSASLCHLQYPPGLPLFGMYVSINGIESKFKLDQSSVLTGIDSGVNYCFRPTFVTFNLISTVSIGIKNLYLAVPVIFFFTNTLLITRYPNDRKNFAGCLKRDMRKKCSRF